MHDILPDHLWRWSWDASSVGRTAAKLLEVVMSDKLPGLHHCISTARAATEVVFRSLRAQCIASGGTLDLSLNELEAFHLKFIDSFSSGYDLFESRHHQCMNASTSLAAMPFAREIILATLLRACGDKSACAAFSLQVEKLGMAWINELFDSLAQYVCEHVNANIEARLIKAYAETSIIPKINLTISELLKQEAVQQIMLECVSAFEVAGAPESITKEICDWINKVVAGKRGVVRPHVCKITENQTRFFLTLLPRQVRATLNGIAAFEQASELSNSVA
jgi:hypothetical protein